MSNRVEVEAESQDVGDEHDPNEVDDQEVEGFDPGGRVFEHEEGEDLHVDGFYHETETVAETCSEKGDCNASCQLLTFTDLISQVVGKHPEGEDRNHRHPESGRDGSLIFGKDARFGVPDEDAEEEDDRDDYVGNPEEQVEHELEPHGRGLCHGFLQSEFVVIS
ncbi:MAG: hypothetical protein UT32_C0011G0023 [Parcubacteria group bacterium GW2011_GWC2_39_14]|nr:MAG: hypothetical protein UT32_C0011G0023 [Parcubacteria group bacterium GW2011_GWC2_39_14]KKR55059.1 MAG: hypothetical protein UT91_C0005G0060 [Parcubacteria group bacterium GW2011_GWA2_40_23]